ncbi:hypothetical protein HB780_18430 [Rhizobium lusitanum]|uniref:hypothetical protein n=1 Tax=Rhizobium lusitanum TaxID=293958 RepID=UPI0016132B7F|nr:hypothetical protein [Rhizobium lusitanum]QND47655.1 hypothetical protein HB780_18430 [Rhizobium lusitanum]
MKNLQVLLAVFTFISCAQASAASDEKLIQLLNNVKGNSSTALLAAYTCRDALGITYYKAIRAYGEQALQQLGASSQATKSTFDALESRFKGDKKLLQEKDVMKCVWVTTEANRTFHESQSAISDYNASAKP